MLMVILDGTIVTVALPAIQDDLGFSAPDLGWVANAYLVPAGGLLLLAGRIGDLLGRRRVFVAGLVVFTVASLLCGVSTHQSTLIVARFVQGVGGALTASVILGMIVMLFPEPDARARAFGVFGFVGAAGASIGVLAGGVLTDALSWHWIFFVNVPVGVLVLVATLRVVGPDRGVGLVAGADVAGAVLVTAGLMLGVYTIVQTGDHGWASARTGVLAAASVALLAGFVGRQARAAAPLVPLRIFRSRSVSGANAVQILMIAAAFGFQFMLALYLQRVLGYSAERTGVAFLPVTLTIGAFSLVVAPRAIVRFGARAALLGGVAFLAVGMALLVRISADGGYAVDVLPTLLLFGVGAGLALPSVTTLAMSGPDAADSGLASGLANTTQQIGGALGIAVLTTLATGRTRDLVADGHDAVAALTAGYRFGFGVGAGLLLAALALATVIPRPAAGPDQLPAPPPDLASEPATAASTAAPVAGPRR
jgi:EmrB/QacA subfamily drug resistance transporter